MPWRTIAMLAPTRSATRDSSFMKLIRVASMALSAYLVNLSPAPTGTSFKPSSAAKKRSLGCNERDRFTKWRCGKVLAALVASLKRAPSNRVSQPRPAV